jgi:predicted SprT family Zn-dependent metalloprotease
MEHNLLPSRLTSEELQDLWRRLNSRHFQGRLPHIEILWSSRLTASAAMFVSTCGPRSPLIAIRTDQRRIRLSTPLLQDQQPGELVNTLAHEMIHQWQFDILKRRPNHGPDFCRKMAEMNGQGLEITIHHSLENVVQRLAKYAWLCTRCGHAYERQRRTIRPGHHRCGACDGPLQEMPARSVPPLLHQLQLRF